MDKSWDHYADFDDAKAAIFQEMMPDGQHDPWAQSLFDMGEYKAWSLYMDEEYGWNIDMDDFWADFRDAYAALG